VRPTPAGRRPRRSRGRGRPERRARPPHRHGSHWRCQGSRRARRGRWHPPRRAALPAPRPAGCRPRSSARPPARSRGSRRARRRAPALRCPAGPRACGARLCLRQARAFVSIEPSPFLCRSCCAPLNRAFQRQARRPAGTHRRSTCTALQPGRRACAQPGGASALLAWVQPAGPQTACACSSQPTLCTGCGMPRCSARSRCCRQSASQQLGNCACGTKAGKKRCFPRHRDWGRPGMGSPCTVSLREQ